MTSDSIWMQVHEVWRRSKIAFRPGVSATDIAAFESKYGVVMPVDVRAYFIAADGTGDAMDEGLYRFWPLTEVQPVHEVLVSDWFAYSDRYSYPDCFVFADHCINCWDYALRLTLTLCNLPQFFASRVAIRQANRWQRHFASS